MLTFVADARVLDYAPPPLPLSATAANTRSAFAAGLSCYLIWGFVAIYFRHLNDRGVDAMHLLAYRITWSTAFIAILLTVLRQWPEVAACLSSGKSILALMGSTIAIAANWWIYIYSVETRQLSYASLGYFMNPLVNVLIGVLLLGERLRKLQVAAVILAALGVCYQTYAIGKLPWISLGLAFSFGFYGLLRKTMRAGPLAGLMVETALLAPLTLAFIGWNIQQGTAPKIDESTHLLVALSGIITATPLLLFAYAARRLKLTTIGFLQYFSPTIQLLIAVLYFGEAFDRSRQVTFAFIWLAVLLFLADQVLAARRSLPVAQPADMET